MAGKQNHGELGDADAMIRNAKALQRVVEELEKNKPKPSLSDGWSRWNRGTEDQLLFRGKFLAVPNLLSLATEIALYDMQRRYELSDDEWHLIQDLFPPPKKMGRPRRDDRTLLFNGVFWILCSGAAWRDLPERYGPWQTAFDRFCKWKQDGTFDRIVEKLHLKLDEDGLLDYAT